MSGRSLAITSLVGLTLVAVGLHCFSRGATTQAEHAPPGFEKRGETPINNPQSVHRDQAAQFHDQSSATEGEIVIVDIANLPKAANDPVSALLASRNADELRLVARLTQGGLIEDSRVKKVMDEARAGASREELRAIVDRECGKLADLALGATLRKWIDEIRRNGVTEVLPSLEGPLVPASSARPKED